MGFQDGSKKRGEKKKARKSASEPEKPEVLPTEETESTTEPVAEEPEKVTPELPTEEKGEPTAEALSETTEEPTSEPATEETAEEAVAEAPVEKAEESTSEPIAEEKKESHAEPPTQEAEEPAPEPVAEKPEELAAESPPNQKTERKIPSPWKLAFQGLFRRKPKKKEKESASEPEKPEVLPTEGIEPTAEPVVNHEKKEVTPEPPAEETTEPTAEPIAEETEKLASETPTQEPEPAPELAGEETKEAAPEPVVAEKTEKPTRAPSKFGFIGSFKKIGQKKKGRESAPEPKVFKLLLLPLTLASMLLGLSIMPLFPQPLPLILAVLIAFLTYKRPIFGMPIGCLAICLGFLYNLAEMDFISSLGSPDIREIVVFAFLFMFVGLPIIFHSRKAAISINLGIIAAISLFSGQTYFLAIPLIVTAIFIFKKSSILAVVYYALISVPFQVLQYLKIVNPIVGQEWWLQAGTSPPVYVPLTGVFADVQNAMLQFRLYDTSLVIDSITEAITAAPPVARHTVSEMLSHYLDSVPGIMLFLCIVFGVVLVLTLFAREFLRKSNIAYGERVIPIVSATVATALFFVLGNSLQSPLAFRFDINDAQIALATFATLIFTLPALMMDFAPKQIATFDMIVKKAEELKAKLQIVEEDVAEVRNNIPIPCGPFEVKIQMIADRINYILSKTSTRLDESTEIDKIFSYLDSLSREIDNLMYELDDTVGEYQIFANCEYSKCLGMFQDIGLETETVTVKTFQQGEPLKKKIEQIKEVIKDSQTFADEVMEVAEQTYGTIRAFYDPTIPEQSPSITFAQKNLYERATPWVALDALFGALNNWNKQYKVQISTSITHLQDSLAAIANLSNKSESLPTVLGDAFPKMIENVKNAEDMKIKIEEKAPKVINVLIMREVFPPSLDIARDVLSILHEKLESEAKAVEVLAPSEELLWEKNDDLLKRMAYAMEVTSKSSNVQLSEVLEKLPKFLSYADECVETIALYTDRTELLLNYPTAEIAVEDLFRQKEHISAEDLPFVPKYAEEYIKLFYSQKFRKFSLDRANMLLTKKT